jgi:hypothetical protein
LPFGGEDATFTRYSDLLSFVVLLGDVVFYIILTWYFDHVAESNRGRGQSPFFPFIKIKNLIFKNKRKRRVLPEEEDL